MTGQSRMDELDRWVAALQAEILERERAVFSAKVIEEALYPQNMGVMREPDGYALVSGPCGDTMEIFLRVEDSRIEIASFTTDGCGPTVACGSILTKMAQGRSLKEAASIQAADVIIALGGLPPEHVHCATLAMNALQEAMAAYQKEYMR